MANQRRATKSRRPRTSGRRGASEGSLELGLIGRDLADRGARISVRRVIPTLVAVLLVALSVAALRIELLKLRYALADATLAEQELLDEERSLTARRRQLRDPVHLARRASELGFVRPVQVIDLPAREDDPVSTFLAAADNANSERLDRP